MKENKGRFPWKDGMLYETVDPTGYVYQYNSVPVFSRSLGYWYVDSCEKAVKVGKVGSLLDEQSALTLIQRYPSDQSETAPAETDAPDLQARVEALEAEVKELRESREMVHKFVPARTYLDDMRFVVPGAKSDVGVLSFTGGIETPAEPDPTAQIAEIEQNERLLPIKQFPWTIEYKSTPIDPTAQKIEALKLLFPWRVGCEYMTVDGRDGHVWQWTVEPVKGKSNCWTALGSDPQARRVGEIGLDPELCQILIKRNDGE